MKHLHLKYLFVLFLLFGLCNCVNTKKYKNDSFRLCIEKYDAFASKGVKILLNNGYALSHCYHYPPDPKPRKSYLYFIYDKQVFDSVSSTILSDTLALKLNEEQVDSLYELTYDFLSKYRADRSDIPYGGGVLMDGPQVTIELMCNRITNVAILEDRFEILEYRKLNRYIETLKFNNHLQPPQWWR